MALENVKGLKGVRSKADRIGEALDKGLKIPWEGVRADLVLHKGVPGADGGETYVLEDPVRGLHFELGEAEVQFFLCLVSEDTLKDAVDKLIRTTALRPTVDDILGFLQMLQREKLAKLPEEVAITSAEMREDKKPSLFLKVITGYLFFKIPLFRPNDFLNALYPWVNPLWSKPFLFLYATLGIVGLVFVSQQIELYLHTVNHLFTPKGALWFFLCLAVLKTFHEMGHAFAARHHGLFVRRVGIAFMVFVPLFYTDTTDAWKLPSRRGRLIIGAAGILVEIAVAGICLFFWSILPDGIPRSLMFYMSGASLISTVLVNLNPLMRFDGYYILMDYLRISNLRTRSLAMFRYYRHRLLVDWRGPKPEEHPLERQMAVFGLFTTLYRIFIFFSISLAIYHKVFKALGVLLLTIQVVLMVILPLVSELLFLLKNWKRWGSVWRVLASAAAFGLLAGALLFPLPNFEKLPAMFLYQDVARIEAPQKGRIVTDPPELGRRVEAGDLLMTLRDDRLEQELEEIGYDLAQVEATIENMGGGGSQGGYRKWLLAERRRLSAAYRKTRQALFQLEIRSPIDGHVADINETLGNGSYVHQDQYLFTVADSRRSEIRAFAPESRYRDLLGEEIGRGRIIFADIQTPSTEGKFREMLHFPVTQFPNDALFDYAGGPIGAKILPEGDVRTIQAHYPLVFDISQPPKHLRHGTGCYVRVREGRRTSIVKRLVDGAWRVLAAEGLV